MGQRVIPVAVTAEYIGGDGVTLGAAGSHNSVLIEYDFRSAGPQWDDISGRYVLWTNPQGNSTNRINLGVSEKVEGYEGVYQAAPPADAMCVPGWAEMVVVGFTLDGDKEVTKIKTEPSRFRVLPGSSRAADNEGVAPTVADQLQAEIEAVNDALESKKVNKPTDPYDSNGVSGQFLQSLGAGKTKWVDPPLPTQEQVEEALEHHKDWVTTVENDSISERKLAPSLRNSFQRGATINPTYIGDYIVSNSYIPSSCLKIGNYFYSFDARSGSNYGLVHKFDIVNNVEIKDNQWPKEALLGHANSVAYDPDRHIIYVAPIWDYTNGESGKVSIQKLYTFSEDFEYLGDVTTPTTPLNISYDPIQKKMYCKHGTAIYLLDDDGTSWSLYTTLSTRKTPADIIHNTTSDQDFAVYDGHFFATTPLGDIRYGALESGNSEVKGTYLVGTEDSAGIFRILGEVEGMEFTSEGHLFCVTFVGLGENMRNAFIVDMPVGMCEPHLYGMSNTSQKTNLNTNYTTLSTETQGKFSLDPNQIRSLLQLICRIRKRTYPNVVIPEGQNVSEPYSILIYDDVMIHLNGEYSASQLTMFNARVAFYSSNDNNKLVITSSGYSIGLKGSAELFFTGNAIRVSLPGKQSGQNFISIDDHFCRTTVRSVPISVDDPAKTLCIGTSPINVVGLYVGSGRISPRTYRIEMTYEDNTCVVSSSFQRNMFFSLFPSFGVFHLNLNVTQLTTSPVKIGTIGTSLAYDHYWTIPPQTNGAETLLLSIEEDGSIYVQAQNAQSASNIWYRGELVCVLA